MHLHLSNINDGFRSIVTGLTNGTIPTERVESRNGPVLRVTEPMTLSFSSPSQRCLFNQARDVNPFSVLYESLWVLAGRNDVTPLSYYTPRMKEYSDDGATWHGAYGHRWRKRLEGDQLLKAASLLRNAKSSRRVVLSMWDAQLDLLEQKEDGKDYPCNTHVYVTCKNEKLNITVCNRSNDSLWGLFGTNYVVFSFLQEYLAALVEVGVGTYHHFSNDLHVYLNDVWKPEEFLRDGTPDFYENNVYPIIDERGFVPDYCYEWESGRYVPLVKNPTIFEKELPSIVGNGYGGGVRGTVGAMTYLEPFFETVAKPMFCAFEAYKTKEWDNAFAWVNRIEASDWKMAAKNWIAKRYQRYLKKGAANVPASVE